MSKFIVFESPYISQSGRASRIAASALSKVVSNVVHTFDHTEACQKLEQETTHGHYPEFSKLAFRMAQVADCSRHVTRSKEYGSTVLVTQWLDYIYARFISGKSLSDITLFDSFYKKVSEECGEPDLVVYIDPDLSDDPSGYLGTMHSAYIDIFDGRPNVITVNSQAPDFEDKIRQTVLSVVTKKRNASSSHSRLGEQG